MFDWRCVERMESLGEHLVWKAAKPLLQLYIPLKATEVSGPREKVADVSRNFQKAAKDLKEVRQAMRGDELDSACFFYAAYRQRASRWL